MIARRDSKTRPVKETADKVGDASTSIKPVWTMVRMEKTLQRFLHKLYGKENGINEIVWSLVDHELDFETVEKSHPEVAEMVLKAAAERNGKYSADEYVKARRAGQRVVRLELE